MSRIVHNSFYLLGFTIHKSVNRYVRFGILLQIYSCRLNHITEFVVQALGSVPLKLLQYIETFEFMEPNNWTMRLVERD